MKRMLGALLLSLVIHAVTHASAAVSVRDDAGNIVTLPRAAQRIVTLAPHTMELVCAAGGCARIVGKGSYSHYPPLVRTIPEIGDNRQVDVERVLALKPDLMVLWRYGISQRTVDQLRKLGIPLFISDPHKLDDIPVGIERVGVLLGTEGRAKAEADRWRTRLRDLKARYSRQTTLSVFYQVSDRPLYTLNDEHIVGEAIRLCGGRNVFGAMQTIAPQIGVEAVLRANPDVIIHTSVDTAGGVAAWKRYPALKAVRNGKLFSLSPDLLDRPGPRLIEGVEALCKVLEQARGQRN